MILYPLMVVCICAALFVIFEEKRWDGPATCCLLLASAAGFWATLTLLLLVF